MDDGWEAGWLKGHPGWTWDQLAGALGHLGPVFLDGDENNHEPSNVALVEVGDGGRVRAFIDGLYGEIDAVPVASGGLGFRKPRGPTRRVLDRGREAYGRHERGETWDSLGGQKFRRAARIWAKREGLAWPVVRD